MDDVVLVAPNAEPLDLAEAKLQARITGTDQDAIISRMVSAARSQAEANTTLQFCHARHKVVLDAFPGREWIDFGAPSPLTDWDAAWAMHRAPRRHLPQHAIVLRCSPAVRVVSVNYLDTSGAPQTVNSSDYVVNLAVTPSYVAPANGKFWPAALRQAGAVSVTYDAGFASKFVADATADTLTVASSPMTWAVNDVVRVSNSGGALPAPLQVNTDYYVKTAASGVYTLSATQGGPTIDLTTAGTGTSYLGAVPEEAIAWMCLFIGLLDKNRELMATLDRGSSINDVPFFDGLLDGLRVYLPS